MPRTAGVVKGSRTPAAAMRLRQGWAAGVGEASGEETAGGVSVGFVGLRCYGELGLVLFWDGRVMAIWFRPRAWLAVDGCLI